MISGARRILIVDDEMAVCQVLSDLVGRAGYDSVAATGGDEALARAQGESFDVVLLDLRMPGMDGMEVLRRVKKLDRDLPVIIVTADGYVPDVVLAFQAGACDYLVKPFVHGDILRAIRAAISERELRRTIHHLAARTPEAATLRESMGSSDAVMKISADVARVGGSDFTVLLLGETGTGKGLVAQAIHQSSAHASGPFVTVDCGAIPETLFESELFGHEKGAFTGADRSKPGKFEIAAAGTLFLDEICNMPLGSQAKLLRVLQERSVCRVGANKPVKMECRVLVAGNQDLERLVREGRFREDLFFRLCEFIIHLPPLRERAQDILFLAKRFLDLTNQELGKAVRGLSECAVERLLGFGWPGNVRQLRSAIRRAVLMADEVIEDEHLGLALASQGALMAGEQPSALNEARFPLKQLVDRATATVERAAILHALTQAHGNKAKAARMLQVDYKTIHTKLKVYGLGTRGGGDHVEEEKS